MKLLINTEPLNAPLTGIGMYTYRLLEQFVQMPDFSDIKAFTGQQILPAQEILEQIYQSAVRPETDLPLGKVWLKDIKKIVRALPGAYRAKQLYGQWVLQQSKQQLTDYLFHETNYVPVSKKLRYVTTIHDLSWLHFPQYLPTRRLQWFQSNMSTIVQQAQQILTVSELVRAEIIEQFKISPDRIHAVYLAADERFHPRTATQTGPVLQAYGLEHGNYLLYVGTIEPRKRVDDLLDAWMALDPRLRQTTQLVVAGGAGWHCEHTLQRLHQLQEQGQLQYLNYVSHADLPVLVAGCKGFVFPSIYEGFGLPVLEAMASGAPVVCREETSMAEFAQGAVLLHSSSVESLSERLTQLLENNELRIEMMHKGLLRARDFSWLKCANSTAKIYQQH